MTLNGPQAIKAIEDALRDIRREEDEITRRIARTTDRIGKLHETEIGQLRALASIRLTPEAQAELGGKLSQAETRARDMLKQHAADLSALDRQLTDHEMAIANLGAARGRELETIATRQAELDALTGTVKASLENDAAYREAVERHAEIAGMADEAKKKAAQSEADREEKGRPYREDVLFIYLWDRGYLTPAYKAGNVARMLDAWVARLVRYAAARPNYAMLNEIPLRLREHAERLAEDEIAAEDTITALETKAFDAAGGRPARAAMEAAQAKIAELDEKLVAAEDAREALVAEQKALAEGRDPKFESAVEVLTSAMRGTDIAQLMDDARKTATPEDDAITIKIDEVRRRVTEDEGELSDQRARLKTLETRRRELEDIEYEFKKARFDDPRSSFRKDDLVGDLLTEFLKGGMTAATYWGHWRHSQDWAAGSGPIVRPTRSSSSPSSGFPIPPGGFSPRPPSGGSWNKPGGGFSRPRSGGIGKKGGFKTGGRLAPDLDHQMYAVRQADHAQHDGENHVIKRIYLQMHLPKDAKRPKDTHYGCKRHDEHGANAAEQYDRHQQNDTVTDDLVLPLILAMRAHQRNVNRRAPRDLKRQVDARMLGRSALRRQPQAAHAVVVAFEKQPVEID
jgi:hypothetical protein